jgi:hypothetical protein
VDRGKRRLCQLHFELLVTLCEAFMFDADHPDVPPSCARCHGPDPEGAAYVTLYDQGAERRDLYAPLHETCGAAWLEAVKNRL